MTNISQNLDFLIPYTRDYFAKIHVSEIARLIKQPQKSVQRKFSALSKLNLLEFKTVGKNKYYYFNFKKISSKSLINLIEIKKEINFLLKHSFLEVLFNELASDTSIILFGSYAKGIEKTDSDLDLLIFGKKTKKIKRIIDVFPLEINAKFSSFNNFKIKLENKNSLALEIVKDHIIFGKKEEFMNCIINCKI